MGSLDPEAEAKQELNDSGYVQDEASKAGNQAEEYRGTAEMLDLSDDVLLFILKYCTPQDLKALGFTCARLGALVLDRTLWVDVDACSAPSGRKRMRWLLTRALGPQTKRLRLKGFAEESDGCLGYSSQPPPEAVAEQTNTITQEEERYLCGGPRVYRLTQTLPKYGGAPSAPPNKCAGPRLTLTHTALRALCARCPSLTTLQLEHCVIDCQTTNIAMFPRTLKKLSLKGTKCFNLESKSFLFKIQDHLSELEELDVSNCTWIEPACMLPLSKMPKLRSLGMRECHKLAEFVAYASLATRYGFKQLEVLDLRGSPVGDSEVSALGWLPRLASLLLSPAPSTQPPPDHAHYSQDMLPADKELDEWEEEEPDYFRPPAISDVEWTRDEEDVRGNRTCYYNSDDPSARSRQQSPLDFAHRLMMIDDAERRRISDRVYEQQQDPNAEPCILLERMIAEPVNPEEYSQVYHQFLAGHNNNVPLADPDEYRESYRQFMVRPTHGHPPAGYSLFIRKPEEDRERLAAGPSKRRRSRADEPTPGTSKDDDSKPGTSNSKDTEKPNSDANTDTSKSPNSSKPRVLSKGELAMSSTKSSDACTATRCHCGPEPDSSSSEESDDDEEPPAKRANKKPKKAKREDTRQPRRVFEITINELSRGQFALQEADVQPNANPANQANAPANVPANVPANAPANVPANAPANAHQVCVKKTNVKKVSVGNQANEEEIDAAAEADCIERRSQACQTIDYHLNENGTLVADSGNQTDAIELPLTSDICTRPGRSTSTGRSASVGKSSKKPAESSSSGRPVKGKSAANSGARKRSASAANASELSKDSDKDNAGSSGNSGAKANDTAKAKGKAKGKAKADGKAKTIEAKRAREAQAAAAAAALEAEDSDSSNAGSDDATEEPNQAPARNRRVFQFRQYRRPIVIEEFINVGDPEAPGVLPRGVLFPGCPTRLDPAALVSDSSIRRFGRAIGENINYIHIGGGIGRDANARPDRSSLTNLSVTGFRHVTDASLIHLSTAAPFLQRLDVSGTGVSTAGVERFRALRPDVEVIYEEA